MSERDPLHEFELPPAHATVTLIVDGAVEEEQVFTDEALLRAYVDEVEADAKDHGYPTQVRILYHAHAIGIPCDCAQYQLDHTPAYTFNEQESA